MKKQIWKKLVIFTLAVAVVMAFALSNQNARLFASEGEEVAAQEPAPAPAPAPAPEPAPAPAPEPAPAPAEEPKAEAPKAEEPKAEAPKAEEPKAEEPKAEEPKAEEPKTEEPKTEEPKAEEPKTEEPKDEETSAEESKTEQTEEEKKEEEQTEEETVLPAAQLPITVKLVDAQGAAVGDGQWTGTVAFAEGQTAADVALPAVEGYVTPALTVERNKDTTALNVTAIYAAAKPAEKASFTAAFAIAGSENGKVTAAGAEATNGYSLKLTEGETLTFTVAPNEGCTATVRINGAEVAIATGSTYSIPMDGDKTVAITFTKPQTEEEAEAEEAEAEKSLEELVNPNRSISIGLAGNPTTLRYGDSVTLVATLSGYENLEYTVRWQYSKDGSSWQDCGVTGETMTVVVTPENAANYWNVLVTITGVK